MIHSKPAPTTFPILSVIQNRWSPVGYDPTQPVDEDQLHSVLEAARWAPSSYNEQPWQYVIGRVGEKNHSDLSDCLVEGNAWAKNAPILMLSLAKKTFNRNEKPNHHCLHDLGAASAFMNLQATELNLAMHQMAGFDGDKARTLFNIGKEYELGAMIALGHTVKDLSTLPEAWAERDKGPRQRKALEEMVWPGV